VDTINGKEKPTMTQIIPRVHPRKTYHLPIEYALLNSDRFEQAHTYDYSAEGLCYESPSKIEPDTEVCIVMQNYTPGRSGPEAYRSYVARIKWINPISNNGGNRYAAGAQIVARSHEVLSTEEKLPRVACDLCDSLEPLNRIRQISEGVYLCRQCLKHFNRIPSEKIRQCVERFLVGNVI
jgi:hypothetical protein